MSLYDDAVLVMIPSAFKATKLYSAKPTDAAGDFTVANAGTKFRTNSDLKLERIAANVPALEYDTVGGCPTLKLNDANTNLLERPLSFGHSDWTKSGSTIEGDPSTAGVELVTNGDFASDVTNWTAWNGSIAWNGSGYADLTSTTTGSIVNSVTFATTGLKLVSFDVKAASYTGKIRVSLDDGTSYYIPDTDVSTGWVTITFQANATASSTNVYLRLVDSHSGVISFDNVSVTEVTGYPSPSVTYPTDAYKLVESSVDEAHYMYSSVNTTVSGSLYTFSLRVKKNEITKLAIYEGNSTGFWVSVDFTDNSVIASNSMTASFKNIIDGWTDLYVTFIAGSSTRLATSLLDAAYTTGNPFGYSYTGDGTSGVYLAFAQLSEKSYAPTFTYSGTEGAESSMLADAFDLSTLQSSALLGTTTGMIYFEVEGATPSTLVAGNFVSGVSYTIVSVGTTDFTAIGASASTIGIVFTATGVGAGTGTATVNADLWLFEDTGGGDELGLRFTSAEVWQWYDHHSSALIGTASASNSTKIAITWSSTSAIISKDGASELVTLGAAFDAITDLSLGASFTGGLTKEIVMSSTLWTAANLNLLTTP